jgi:hypothetical protein
LIDLIFQVGVGGVLTVGSGSWSSAGVAGGNAALPECGEHGGVVDAQVLADSGEGPAEGVEGIAVSTWSRERPRRRMDLLCR